MGKGRDIPHDVRCGRETRESVRMMARKEELGGGRDVGWGWRGVGWGGVGGGGVSGREVE